VIQLNRILAPTDFSQHSENALRYACELADRFEAELHLLSVLDDTTPMFVDPEIIPMDSLVQQQRVAISEKLDQQPGSPWDKNLTVVREMRQGSPFLEIIRYAKENNIGLIVLGTHGRSGLAHVLLGSVAERVVRIAPCPVLTVRHPEHEFVMP
jgi:nucleotide-binding universal stress UspA family protein